MDERPKPNGEIRDGRGLPAWSIQRPVTICMLFVSLVVIGLIAASRLPLVLMPSVEAPFLVVYAPYKNATPHEILETITKPIEEVISTIPGVKRMSSYSSADTANVQVMFSWGVDLGVIRTEIRDKIDQIRNDLPDDLRKVYIRGFSTDDIPILVASIGSDRDLRSDYDLLDAKIKKPLERIPGVAEVNIWGVQRRRVDIYLRLDDVKRYRVDVDRLFRRLDGSNLNLSLGNVDEAGLRYGAVARGTMDDIAQVASFPVNERGLRLEQIADIVVDDADVNFGQHLNGESSIGFEVKKNSEANTVETVRLVKEAIDKAALDPALGEVTIDVWHDAGREITKSLTGLLESGTVGAFLAVLTLFVFLLRFDLSFVIGLAIPFSLIAALGFLYFSGNTLNILSMMGLMLSTGMLVDNAVVVLESIYQKLEKGLPRAEAARIGAGEVVTAVIAATSTSMIIFVPLIFASDNQISIFLGEAGVSIICALSCSLFISLTLIPVAMAKFLRAEPGNESKFGGWAADASHRMILAVGRRFFRRETPDQVRARFEGDWVSRAYLKIVEWPLQRRFLTGFLLVPLLVGGGIYVLMKHVPTNSPDATGLSSVSVRYRFTENFHYAKIEQDYVNPVERFIEENRDRFGVKSYRSFYSNNSAQTQIYFDETKVSGDDMTRINEEISKGLPVVAGAEISTGNQNNNRANYVSANIYGDDPRTLNRIAADLKLRFQSQPNFEIGYVSRDSVNQEAQIRLDRDLARKYGVNAESVSQVLGIIIRARQMRGFRTPDGEIEMWVQMAPQDIVDLSDLESVVVGSRPDGRLIELGQVSDLTLQEIPERIMREDRRAFSEFSVIYKGDQIEQGREKFTEIMNSHPFPPGYGWAYSFYTKQQEQQNTEFIFNLVLALIMVYFVMASLFESLTHPFAIMLSLPFTGVGIAAMLLACGSPFNEMSMIGLLVLVGIVVNNGIVLIDHINAQRRLGMSRYDAILLGCRERLRPILMTASTTVVGMLPLAFGETSLGGMRYFPMAQTIIGGLVASTALTLIVLPTYYTLLDDLGRWVRHVWVTTAPGARGAEPAAGD